MRSLEGIPLNGLNLLGGNCEATQLQMISHQPGRQSSAAAAAAAVLPDLPRLCIYTTLPAVRRRICWPLCWLAGSLAHWLVRLSDTDTLLPVLLRWLCAVLCCVLFDGLAVHCSLFVRRPPLPVRALRLYATSPSALGHRQCPCSSAPILFRFVLVWFLCVAGVAVAAAVAALLACLALPGWPGTAASVEFQFSSPSYRRLPVVRFVRLLGVQCDLQAAAVVEASIQYPVPKYPSISESLPGQKKSSKHTETEAATKGKVRT